MTLGKLAREAFAAQEKWGVVSIPTGQMRSRTFDGWRHQQQHEACGISSLTACDQRHYRLLKAHFAKIAGKSDVAFGNYVRTGQGQERREVALWHCRKDCAAFGFAYPAYARELARDKFGTPDLDALTEKQAWQIVYTVRTRGRQKAACGRVSGLKSQVSSQGQRMTPETLKPETSEAETAQPMKP